MIRWTVRRALGRMEPRHDASRTHDNRIAHPLAAVALVCGLGLAAPSAAQVSVQPAVNAPALTPKRALASGAAVTGLIGALIGGLALARSASPKGRRAARVALVLGPIAVGIGGLVVATADGGPGTGNGLAGGAIAMMVGLIGMALGGLALSRSRRGA